MAKKKTIIEENVPDQELPNVAWGDDDDVVSQLKMQYGIETIKVKVYKIVPPKTQPTFCFVDTTDNFKDPEEQLINCGFGGGRYVCVWYSNEGKRLYEKSYEIAERPALTEKKDMTVADVQIAMLKEQSQMNR